jgi:hypothetical protein
MGVLRCPLTSLLEGVTVIRHFAAALVVLAALLALPASAGEPKVTVSAASVDVSAKDVPLATVLDSVSKATRVKVIYDGPIPMQPVSLDVHERDVLHAVTALCTKLGLNFGVKTDPTGKSSYELLLVTRPVSPAPAQAAANAPSGTQGPEPASARESVAEKTEETPAEPKDAQSSPVPDPVLAAMIGAPPAAGTVPAASLDTPSPTAAPAPVQGAPVPVQAAPTTMQAVHNQTQPATHSPVADGESPGVWSPTPGEVHGYISPDGQPWVGPANHTPIVMPTPDPAHVHSSPVFDVDGAEPPAPAASPAPRK